MFHVSISWFEIKIESQLSMRVGVASLLTHDKLRDYLENNFEINADFATAIDTRKRCS